MSHDPDEEITQTIYVGRVPLRTYHERKRRLRAAGVALRVALIVLMTTWIAAAAAMASAQ